MAATLGTLRYHVRLGEGGGEGSQFSNMSQNFDWNPKTERDEVGDPDCRLSKQFQNVERFSYSPIM